MALCGRFSENFRSVVFLSVFSSPTRDRVPESEFHVRCRLRRALRGRTSAQVEKKVSLVFAAAAVAAEVKPSLQDLIHFLSCITRSRSLTLEKAASPNKKAEAPPSKKKKTGTRTNRGIIVVIISSSSSSSCLQAVKVTTTLPVATLPLGCRRRLHCLCRSFRTLWQRATLLCS